MQWDRGLGGPQRRYGRCGGYLPGIEPTFRGSSVTSLSYPNTHLFKIHFNAITPSTRNPFVSTVRDFRSGRSQLNALGIWWGPPPAIVTVCRPSPTIQLQPLSRYFMPNFSRAKQKPGL